MFVISIPDVDSLYEGCSQYNETLEPKTVALPVNLDTLKIGKRLWKLSTRITNHASTVLAISFTYDMVLKKRDPDDLVDYVKSSESLCISFHAHSGEIYDASLTIT